MLSYLFRLWPEGLLINYFHSASFFTCKIQLQPLYFTTNRAEHICYFILTFVPDCCSVTLIFSNFFKRALLRSKALCLCVLKDLDYKYVISPVPISILLTLLIFISLIEFTGTIFPNVDEIRKSKFKLFKYSR